MISDRPHSLCPQPDARIGVLLVNVGTPSAPTKQAVRKYIIELLSDRRLIDVPRMVWLPFLHGVIVPKRVSSVTSGYQEIWLDDGTKKGSPLLWYSQRMAEQLQEKLRHQHPGSFTVRTAMRYGTPGIQAGLTQLQDRGCKRILILPLAPQYSGAITASSFDAITDHLRQQTLLAELRFIGEYHDSPAYIQALASSVNSDQHRRSANPSEILLISFHGLPQHSVDAGDPYLEQCQTTARLLAAELGLDDHQWRISFQSRFGRREWIKPYTEDVVNQLASDADSEVAVICPGFPADCLETLEEIQITYRDQFLAAGGKSYHYIPALNDSSEQVEVLAELTQRHSQGWTTDRATGASLFESAHSVQDRAG